MRSWVVIFLVACGGGSATTVDAPAAGSPDAPPGVVEDVHLIGRFDDTGQFAWPGSRILTRFTGTQIALDLDDSGQNWFEITIDGQAQTPLHASAGRMTYMLATGLSDGPHDLEIARRTESFFGTSTFHGFPGATLVATPRPTRLIEFIGDSITCGYGVLGVGPTCSFAADTEAESHAWGTLAAAAVGAQHASIAYSGIGMLRNYGQGTTGTMPERYGRLFAEAATPAWDFRYTPDVIVIDLGTNDFNGGDPGAGFATTYTTFVQMLRAKFPSTPVLLATSPMLDGTARTQLRAYLDQVAGAVDHVTVVDIAEQLAADGFGCDYHPSETTAHKMADAIVPAIRTATGW